MEALTKDYKKNISSCTEGVHILLVGSYQTKKLRQTLETENQLTISEARNDDEVITVAGAETPDVVIALTDNVTPIEDFNNTLATLSRIQLNTKTIIISDNPFRYLRYALKAKVAALLYRKIDNRDLVPIIHEVRTWSHGQPIPTGISSMNNQPGPETKSGGE
jgi:DNA-binding NarL/FixJ family response regulator